MKITVLVPTYRRPQDLARCLAALQKQERVPDEVVVVARPDDEATHACLADPLVVGALPLNVAAVELPGQVAALNRGLDAATGDVIAITDDDAAPHADWVRRIGAAFESDARLGALGGRDWVHQKGGVLDGSRFLVGKMMKSGKIIGNHHLGVGEAREVDLLKGANMSYRRDAVRTIRFDGRLRGAGAQVHNDMAFSMSVKNAGWKLVYDPRVAVDHYPAERFDEDRRDAQSLTAVRNAAYNLHLILREQLPAGQREVAWWWYALVGTRVYPGALHAVLALTSKGARTKLARWHAVRTGAREARRAFAQQRGTGTGTGTGVHA
ncbi:glycosyltransferase family 2 protein [Paraburkholderia terrae]|uniref:Glycosyl transferase n=1 Tax=Paraburkholderia terrae TaxID=311230 RepID=A0ABM7TG06_9BURK|nr:glycosyltransferase family 2 protein [Paraburkholderia terrae]BCZ77873.1 glycosyl transferase [Paraburkholderia terrae]